MKSLLIVNPTSGQGRAAREKRRLHKLASTSPDVVVAVPDSAGETIELARTARERGFDRVLAAGGDGTINCVINGVGTSGIPVGIIPLGTGNVLARDLGVPCNDVRGALDIIAANRVRAVDLGRVGDRLFTLMTGFGFDAEVVDGVSPKIKDIFGTMAYAGPVLARLFTYAPTRFKLTFENGPVYEADAYAVVIANCGTYASNLQIAPHAVFDDGLLDVMIFEAGPGAAFRFVGQALEVFSQKQINDPFTTYFKSAGVMVESNPRVKMQVDGDVCGESGVRVEVLRKALNLIVPG